MAAEGRLLAGTDLHNQVAQAFPNVKYIGKASACGCSIAVSGIFSLALLELSAHGSMYKAPETVTER
jgi:hypothetical protein